MGLSDLLDRIKAALGIGGTRGQQSRTRPPREQTTGQQPGSESAPETTAESTDEEGTTVTVEREPTTESEDAVKGTDTSTEGGGATADSDEESARSAEAEGASSTDETEVEPESSAAETEEPEAEAADLGTDEPTDVIKGIGSTYADRLSEAGVETVADLATSDPETLAEETGISESRIENWVGRAKHR
jgi:predicted flap endonuclease-1-like 5' DNA nuclease